MRTPTLLPIESFRDFLEWNPFGWWGLWPQGRRQPDCSPVLAEYAWQRSDAVGRESVRRALQSAETRLAEYLGYWVAPQYGSVTVPYAPIVELGTGYVQALGAETYTLVGASGGVALTYSDQDGDGINDTFTCSVATTETDPERLGLYFIPADRVGDDTTISERWRVVPVGVSLSGGVATFTGRAWLCVKPARYEGLSTQTLDPTNAANFATHLNVYRRYPDTQQQSTLIWDQWPYPGYCCTGSGSTDPAATATATARVGLVDSVLGLVAPAEAVYDATAGTWSATAGWSGCRPPDRVQLHYLAGLPLVSGQMHSFWQMVLSRLTVAELARPLCACDEANKERYHWQVDMARTGGNADEAFGLISADDLSNPLGTRRGHIATWRVIQQYRQLSAFAI